MTPIALAPQFLIDACDAILQFFHDQVGFGWGLSIIAMTVAIRVAILPLTFKGVKGMQEMQRLQPEMKRIQERYKADKQRMQQEVMKLYQEHQVNPLSSCLPLLLQIPFFIALFDLLRNDPEIEGEPFLFIPDLGSEATGAVLVTLIVLYIATQLGASLVTLVSADKTQRRIFLALPFVFVLFILNFPAGLIVYWITTNIWTVGQQLVVKKLYPKPEPFETKDGDGAAAKPAHGKPATQAALVDDGAGDGKPGRRATATVAAASGNGGPRKAPPPPSPRKKKKRSGRRR
ncbi:MAG: YidC/Oxa1 family membrane protein insertase [Thermoleophilaceae bacterium]